MSIFYIIKFIRSCHFVRPPTAMVTYRHAMKTCKNDSDTNAKIDYIWKKNYIWFTALYLPQILEILFYQSKKFITLEVV